MQDLVCEKILAGGVHLVVVQPLDKQTLKQAIEGTDHDRDQLPWEHQQESEGGRGGHLRARHNR
jgi:hypothetical protein